MADLLASRFPVTLALTLMSTVLSLLISLPLGYFAGTHKDRLGDQAVRTASLVANIALACILIFVGFFLYHEGLTLRQAAGIVVCFIGLLLIRK